jgi:CRP/FNR family nitrogen fixation transcriptional regulator
MIPNASSPRAVAIPSAAAQISLFADCGDVIGVASTYQQNEEVYGEGEPAERVYKVISGVVRTYQVLDDGRRQISAFHFPGDIFGLEPEEAYASTAEAVVPAKIAAFQRRHIVTAASRSVGVARELWARAARNLLHAESHMLLLGRKTALERVVAFLVEMRERGQCAGQLNLPMSRRDIADYLGLTLETVSRALSQLQSEGGLQLSGARRIELRSRKLLGGTAKAA